VVGYWLVLLKVYYTVKVFCYVVILQFGNKIFYLPKKEHTNMVTTIVTNLLAKIVAQLHSMDLWI